jgi:choline dehydrogenase-like flavoprotein
LSDDFDVIVIGTGAGGGTLAHTIAQTGKRILLLERGDFLTKELGDWDPGPVFVDGQYISPNTWYDDDGTPFQPQVHYFVGGATKMCGAALYRLRPEDLGELSHVDGISPAWPVSYTDFEVVHQGRVALPGTRQPRRGSHRGALLAAVSVAGGFPRAAGPGHRRCPRQGRLPPVPRTLRDPAR